MAAVKFKKMTLAAMSADRARLMRALQCLGCADIIESADNVQAAAPPNAARRGEFAAWIARLDAAIEKLAPYDPIKRGAFARKPVAGEDAVAGALAWRGQARQITDRLEEISRLLAETGARESNEKNFIEALKPWAGFAAPLERLGETPNTVSGLFIIPARGYNAFADAARALEIPAALSEINRSGRKVYVMMAAHKLVGAAMDLLICGATRAPVDDFYDSVLVNIDQAGARLRRAVNERAELNRELARLGGEIHALRTLRDVEAAELDRLDAMLCVKATRSAFILRAWVPAGHTAALEKALRGTVSACELMFMEPDASEKPPRMKKNCIFSLPRRRGVPFKPFKYNTRYVEISGV
jgi:vacuolar-type H+-ATPase subunit I/STV1